MSVVQQLPPKKQLIGLCDELLKAVEELLLAGLTTASKSTIERIDLSFKEASRMKLLRLGSNLRSLNEEIARFHAGSAQFSARRLTLFLGRSWFVAHGIRRALDANDDAALSRVTRVPPTEPLRQPLKVVTLGVGKRVSAGSSAGFEFRLRDIETGERIFCSKVFGMPKDASDFPAEGFLHLPFSQKQKWKPSLFLERKVLVITGGSISRQEDASTRWIMDDSTTISTLDPFDQWASLWTWDRQRSFERLKQHRTTPMDLDVELQEEVVLDEWEAGQDVSQDETSDIVPLTSRGLMLHARLDRGPSGVPLKETFKKIACKKRKRPPLFGVMHYESCRLVFQPLSILADNGPEYLTISPDKVSQAALVKAMKFT